MMTPCRLSYASVQESAIPPLFQRSAPIRAPIPTPGLRLKRSTGIVCGRTTRQETRSTRTLRKRQLLRHPPRPHLPPRPPPPLPPPAAPSNLGATATTFSDIMLSWTDNSSDEDGFAVERCVGSWSGTF